MIKRQPRKNKTFINIKMDDIRDIFNDLSTIYQQIYDKSLEYETTITELEKQIETLKKENEELKKTFISFQNKPSKKSQNWFDKMFKK